MSGVPGHVVSAQVRSGFPAFRQFFALCVDGLSQQKPLGSMFGPNVLSAVLPPCPGGSDWAMRDHQRLLDVRTRERDPPLQAGGEKSMVKEQDLCGCGFDPARQALAETGTQALW